MIRIAKKKRLEGLKVFLKIVKFFGKLKSGREMLNWPSTNVYFICYRNFIVL